MRMNDPAAGVTEGTTVLITLEHKEVNMMELDAMADRFLRARDCAHYFGIGKSTWWRWVSEGKVGGGLLLGPRIRVWRLSYLKKIERQLAQDPCKA